MCGVDDVMTAGDCVKASATLLACYVGITINMPEKDKVALMRVFDKIFSAYPKYAALNVCDPNKGLPRTVGFIPKPSELSDALESEVTKRRAYAVKAQWHIDEAKRRADGQKLDDECSKLTPESKAALVAKALLRIKPIPLNHESDAA
jgi:hypothetical protein